MHNDNLFKWLTKEIADFDQSGYTIQYPPMLFWDKYRPEYQVKIAAAWEEALAYDDGSLGLYVHIPFCRQRCLYCRYFSVALGQKRELSRYLRTLADERKFMGKFSRTGRFALFISAGERRPF